MKRVTPKQQWKATMNGYEKQGWNAYIDGRKRDENPYDKRHEGHQWWDGGWAMCEARDGHVGEIGKGESSEAGIQ